ncbi:substrate-binding periplasmic protein [Thalassotalea profundi]|uniref:Solute-binding protein family 3/N-terminal domain-containing protein n=1 Tax=Thalassotalea profundi TaxID=2036687 RepID=A0ABQ3ISI4_9GAMM|nr:transporter substrate-binding domain-containing protein [Thalassotalea profundi]GHE92428.1 hypothetical protein GCM10011501_22460 [Thalassotalea profundi]
MISPFAYSKETLKCATTHYPPYTIYDSKSGNFTGYDMDIINAFAKNLNTDISVTNLPWARLKLEIKKNNYDCFFSLANLVYREEYLDFTTVPTHVTKIAIFYPKNIEFESIDFSQKVIGVHRGINFHEDVTHPKNLQLAKFHKLQSNEVLFEMLKSKRVDLVLTSMKVGQYLLEKNNINDKFNMFEIEGYQLPVFIAFTKGKFDLEIFNSALESVIGKSKAKN